MRKIRIDRETVIDEKVVKWIIEKHKEEKARISNLKEYYNNNNTTIMKYLYLMNTIRKLWVIKT